MLHLFLNLIGGWSICPLIAAVRCMNPGAERGETPVGKPYIFLDRDGTINKEKDYLYRIEDFEFEDGCVEGLRLLQDKGYGLVVITNQSGIARGYYTLEDANRLHAYMTEQLKEAGVALERVYLCPHGPDDHCECRKPKIGLYRQAMEELQIDMARSYMVGDRVRDIEPAQHFGSRYALVQTGHCGSEDLSKIDKRFLYKNLAEFAQNVPEARC